MPPSSSPEVEYPDTQFLGRGSLTKDTAPPTSLRTSISPPPSRSRRSQDKQKEHSCDGHSNANEHATPNLAAIEAGELRIDDHISHFSTHLARFVRPPPSTSSKSYPLLPITEWQALYRRNQHAHGHHFVVHQHDHPVAGVHYDLRLQINKTSSISWAIMYGLPGNANSRRLNRNAMETRVHCIWVGG
ncbi:hypothetical protein N7G274_008985 [Stereocaulon virgatum]|uniref:DNA ligase D 3'-phosphoesterase domain-containing protein n=1 Tax=Stereocaulon virgatum TaxID=373712 RepID=A0ABR3ZZA7_9LECA